MASVVKPRTPHNLSPRIPNIGEIWRLDTQRGDGATGLANSTLPEPTRRRDLHPRRADGNEQIILQLWLAPWQVESEPVWVGQVYYATLDKNWLTDLADEGFAGDSGFFSLFANESVSADVDSAIYFLLQNFWYNPSLRQWALQDNAFTRIRVAPHSIRSGYIFSRVDEGTKSFNVDVFGGEQPYMMIFFVPVPGLKLDHYEVNIGSIYPESELESVDLDELVARLEKMPCCVRDAKGEETGDQRR
jgi:hypothetical protein